MRSNYWVRSALTSLSVGVVSALILSYEASNGVWAVPLIAGAILVSFTVVRLFKGKMLSCALVTATVFTGIFFLIFWLGNRLEHLSREKSAQITTSVTRFKLDHGRPPRSVDELKPNYLDNKFSTTQLSMGIRYGLVYSAKENDMCVVRYAFPGGKKIRCSTWLEEQVVPD